MTPRDYTQAIAAVLGFAAAGLWFYASGLKHTPGKSFAAAPLLLFDMIERQGIWNARAQQPLELQH